jgi:putative flippase GtrA
MRADEAVVMNFHEHRALAGQASRFLLATAASAGVSLGLPIMFREIFRVTPEVGVPVAFVIAFFVSLLTTRRFVFASPNGFWRDFGVFSLSTACFRGAEYVAFLFLYRIAGVYYAAALGMVLTISAVAKFIWYRFAIGR